MLKLTFLTVMPSPYQRQLFQAIADRNEFDLKVAYYTVGAKDREWKAPELETHEEVLPGSTLSMLGNSAHLNLSIARWLAKRESDLTVISDYSAPTAQIAMRVLAQRNEPFVFWGEAPGFQNRGALGKWVRRRLQSPIAKAEGIAAIGSRAAGIYAELFPNIPVSSIAYYCDLQPYIQASETASETDRATIEILFSGQLIERKGIDTLIRAFIRASEEEGRLRLSILGGGPLRSALTDLLPEHLTEKIRFLGHVEPSEIPPIFAQHDIFCLPSRYDGWGVVVNEALGAGMPLLVSDAVGAGHDIVSHGENGLVTQAGDEDALAEALLQISNDETRLRMSAAATRRRQDWTIQKGAERWSQFAHRVLDREVIA